MDLKATTEKHLEAITEIAFAAAGGTIDKSYAAGAGVYNFEIAQPAIGKILQIVNPNFEYEVISILKMDSLDMTDVHFKIVYDALSQIKCNRITLSMGTDRLIDLAEALSELDTQYGQLRDKTIVVYGASLPERFKDSDAQFNAGVAVGAVNVLPPGVYVAMSGLIYYPKNCKKDPETGKFVYK